MVEDLVAFTAALLGEVQGCVGLADEVVGPLMPAYTIQSVSATGSDRARYPPPESGFEAGSSNGPTSARLVPDAGRDTDSTADREIVVSRLIDQTRTHASPRVTHLTYTVGKR